MSNSYIYPVQNLFKTLTCLTILFIPWSTAIAANKKAEAQKAAKEDAPYIYNAEGKRNPFQVPKGIGLRPEERVPKKGEIAKPVRIREYLEQFQLDSLKLVAILFHIEGQQAAAMVRDPEGKGHMIHVGQYIGVNEGRISDISDGTVTIVEPTPALIKKERTITLRLHKKDEK
ncbi:MAG: pilus assembly protein PilP [Magnetococcales bacterium]|nr:pilus assembly protein PilP [Magnetococcales bacterium]